MLLPSPAEIEVVDRRAVPRPAQGLEADERRARPRGEAIVDYSFRWFGKKFLTTEQQGRGDSLASPSCACSRKTGCPDAGNG
jgi:hypothetical protein